MPSRFIPQSIWHQWVMSLKPASVADPLIVKGCQRVVKDRLRLLRSVRHCFLKHGAATHHTGGQSRVVRRGNGCRCPRSGHNNVGLAKPLSIALSNAILLFVVGCQAHRWHRWQAVRAAIYAMYVCHLWWPRTNCGRARRLHEQRRLQACRVCNLRCFVQSSRGGSNDRDDSSHPIKPREQAEPLQPALGGPSRARLNLPATPASIPR